MRLGIALIGFVAAAASAAHADSQSSNTSSNSSSNNGVVRERVVDSFCENGYCERLVERRVYRDGKKQRRSRSWGRYEVEYPRKTWREGDD